MQTCLPSSSLQWAPTIVRWLLLATSLAVTGHAVAQPIVVDNRSPNVNVSSGWRMATGASQHYGQDSLYVRANGGLHTVQFIPELPEPNRYEVEAWNSCYSPRATAVPHIVHYADGDVTVVVDQDPSSGDCGGWISLGTYPFKAGTDGWVEISDNGVLNAYVGADAVRFTPVDVMRLRRAAADAHRLYLDGEHIPSNDAGLSVTMPWPPNEPCPWGAPCATLQLPIESASSTSLVVSMPNQVQPGTYLLTVATSHSRAQIPLVAGNAGVAGETGATGPAGVPGETGPRGQRGAEGKRGADGPPGVPGEQGPMGIQGPAGRDAPQPSREALCALSHRVQSDTSGLGDQLTSTYQLNCH